MTLALVRTALTAMVKGIDGVDACYPRIPETKPPADRFAVIETASSEIGSQGADLERRTHLIYVYFLVPRNSDLWAEQVAVEPFIDAFPDAVAAAISLGGLTYGTRYTSPAWEMVTAEIKDRAYIGPRFGTLHKEKATLSYSG